MSESIVLKEQLTSEMVEAGALLTQKLDDIGVSPVAAFWHFYPEVNEWRLVFASPDVATKGARVMYGKILHAIDDLGEKAAATPLTTVVAMDDRVELIRLLREAVPTGAGLHRVRFSGSSIKGRFVEDALMLTTLRTSPDRQSPSSGFLVSPCSKCVSCWSTWRARLRWREGACSSIGALRRHCARTLVQRRDDARAQHELGLKQATSMRRRRRQAQPGGRPPLVRGLMPRVRGEPATAGSRQARCPDSCPRPQRGIAARRSRAPAATGLCAGRGDTRQGPPGAARRPLQ